MKEYENREMEQEVQEVPSILAKRRLLPGDRVLWVIVAMFFAISMVVVYSATSQLGFKGGSMATGAYLQKHIVTLCLSAVIMFFCYILGAKFLRKVTWLAYIGALLLTVAAYFFGDATNDAHRWIDLGFFRFQPSELLKIGTIMLLAAKLSAKHHRIKQIHLLPSTIDVRKWATPRERDIIFDEIFPIVLPIALSCMAILPAHTSSAIHLFIVSIVMLFIAGIRWQEILKLTIIAAATGLLVIFTVGRGGVVINRIMEFTGLRKEAQTEQVHRSIMERYSDSDRSRMAIQNGGLFGVGAGRSVMRARLTHPESDYLFAIVVEEFGLLFSFVIVLLYLWLFFRALRIFEKCEWLYAGLLAVGLALLVTSQGFLHVGVTIGILPETGQNLPFLTQGRTGMFCASIAVGIILGISRQVEQGTLVPPSQQPNNKHI
ncbi:MAG: FtsW/RodA/SpoVE family cell cycle protein [Rikenellaceae bacterium]|nr:FtsW/RodA/SpoVE family cell cycle protein [Rikenellaceae bacterium]